MKGHEFDFICRINFFYSGWRVISIIANSASVKTSHTKINTDISDLGGQMRNRIKPEGQGRFEMKVKGPGGEG
jgi:hypothetical protein